MVMITGTDPRSLESCAYSANVFKETLNKIQKAVDDLSLRQYSNLHAWVGKLDEAVESKLALRLQVIEPFKGLNYPDAFCSSNSGLLQDCLIDLFKLPHS